MLARMNPTWTLANSPEVLGRCLAEARAKRGLTQSQVASTLGISRRYLCEIEAGKPGLYSERLFRLLGLLGVDLALHAADARPAEDALHFEAPLSAGSSSLTGANTTATKTSRCLRAEAPVTREQLHDVGR